MRVNLRAAGRNRFQPRLEALEDRQVPAFSVWQQGATLFLKGSSGPDYVDIQDAGNGNYNVQADGNFGVNYSGISRIRINAYGGDDGVTFYVDNKSMGSPTLRMDVDLGSGNDKFDADIYGSGVMMGPAIPMAPCHYEFNVDGGSGNDDIYMGFFADLHSGDRLRVRLNGQSGNDYVGFRYGGSNYGGAIHTDVFGGSGSDTVNAFLGSTSSEGYNAGTIQLDVGGESGNDNLFFGFETYTNGNGELLPLNGYTYENTGELKVRMRGGSGDDTLGVGLGDNAAFNNSGDVKFAIDGGAGKDNINVGTLTMMNPVTTGSAVVETSIMTPLINTGSIDLSVEGGSNKDDIHIATILAADATDAYFRVRVKGEGNADNIHLAAYPNYMTLGKVVAQVKAGPLDYLWVTPNVQVQGARSSRITYLPL
ncbi:MAG: hypothetical protein U0796_04600 [Gemmatales bacterium]